MQEVPADVAQMRSEMENYDREVSGTEESIDRAKKELDKEQAEKDRLNKEVRSAP